MRGGSRNRLGALEVKTSTAPAVSAAAMEGFTYCKCCNCRKRPNCERCTYGRLPAVTMNGSTTLITVVTTSAALVVNFSGGGIVRLAGLPSIVPYLARPPSRGPLCSLVGHSSLGQGGS